jgi:sugar phosphate isomerase/epimerase
LKKGLTKAGIGNIEDILFIQKAAEYGFDTVDLDVKGIVEGAGVERVKEALDLHRIEIGACDLNVDWRNDQAAFVQDLSALSRYADAANRLGIPVCTTYVLPSTDEKPASYMARVINRLRGCAQVLQDYDLKLAVEFVGPHHLRTAWKHPFIWTIDETLDLIEAIGLPNVGLLVDSYHVYTTGMMSESLSMLRADQIVHVHLNDAKDQPPDQLLDHERLYPGEGVLDLRGFVHTLKQLGYAGVVSQEVLGQAGPPSTMDELFERSRAGFAKVFQGIQ